MLPLRVWGVRRGSSWGNAVKSFSRQVYGKAKRVQMNVAAAKEMEEAQGRIVPELVDKAEEEIKRKHWGEFGEGGEAPQTILEVGKVLLFCVKEDPELKKTKGLIPTTSHLTQYELHKSAVCQSMYLMTLEQVQRLYPSPTLELLTIDLLTKANEFDLHHPRVLPNDKESIQLIFQHWSDTASKEAGTYEETQ